MGCTKCRQEKIIEENKKNEIQNPYTKDNRINIKPTSILDKLNSRIDDNSNVYIYKEVLKEEEIQQLDELIKKIKKNKRLLLLLKNAKVEF